MFNVYCIRTTFVPDEYWQSMEIAHRFVYGYGYLTWEWTEKMRSPIHPAIISIFYQTLKYFQLDSPNLLISTPYFVHAVLQVICDVF
eukprot:Pgem_evm1s8880